MVRLRFRARRPAANLGPESSQWKAEPLDGWKLQQLIARLGSGLPIHRVRKRLRQSVWAPGSLSCEDPANSQIRVPKSSPWASRPSVLKLEAELRAHLFI